MNPVAEAVLVRVRASLNDLRAGVRDTPSEGLNWQPGDDTNSIAAQITHLLKSADFSLNAAAGADRDMGAYLKVRAGTFGATADAAALLSLLDEFEGTIESRLAAIEPSTFADVIDWSVWDRGRQTVAYVLVGVAEHMREHVGAIGLTRQLWEQRQRR
jgi:hypothetical protein